MIDEKIKNWGVQEGQTWSIAQKVDGKIEKIKEEDKALGDVLEWFVEGFGDGLSDFILLT